VYVSAVRAASLILAMALPMQADWTQLSPEELAKQSDLIVVGEFLGSEPVRLSPQLPLQNIGSIRVDQVLKGDASRKVALLLLPMPRPNGLVSSADIRVEKGQRGLWYLKLRAEGLYVVDHPDRFLAMTAAEPRIRAWKAKR
jgi:hypothetical protein